jgi:DNA gyrase subunit A
MGRNAAGVKGVTLESDKDIVVGLVCVEDQEANLLVVSEKGYGKRSDLEDYRITGRGGKGVKTMNVTEKTGQLVSIKDVTDKDELMIINKSGILIRLEVRNLRVMGRATQGVRLINLSGSDEISSVAKIEILEVDELEEGAVVEGEEGIVIEGTENSEINPEASVDGEETTTEE